MKSYVEDFVTLVWNPDALLKRLLRETRMLRQPIDFAGVPFAFIYQRFLRLPQGINPMPVEAVDAPSNTYFRVCLLPC